MLEAIVANWVEIRNFWMGLIMSYHVLSRNHGTILVPGCARTLDFFSWKITKLGWSNVQTRLGGTCGPGAFPGATQKNLQPCKPWPGQPPKKIIIKTKNYHPFFPGLWMLSERTHPWIIRVYRKITRITSDIMFDDKWNHMLAENARNLMSNWDWSPQMLQTCPSRNVNTAI